MGRLIIAIIIAICSFIGMLVCSHELDKKEEINRVDNALYIGGISICSILLGLMLGFILLI